MDDLIESIVIQNGSFMMKAGYAGDDAPRTVFPTVIGKPKGKYNSGKSSDFIGDEAQSKQGILNIRRPIEKGIINNWNDMEAIWHHTFYNELRRAPEEYDILMTESPFISNQDQEKMMQIMFETFNVKGYHGITSETLAIYSSGRTSGIVLNMGDKHANAVPIIDGVSIKSVAESINFGGDHIIEYLQRLIQDRGYSFMDGWQRHKPIFRDIKQKLGYIALDYEIEIMPTKGSSELEQNYELPDGQVLTIGAERFKAPEILFRPSLIDNTLVDTRLEPLQQKLLINGFSRNCLKDMIYQDIDKVVDEFVGRIGYDQGIHGLLNRVIMNCPYNGIKKHVKDVYDSVNKYMSSDGEFTMKDDEEMIETLYKNIVIVGGTSMYQGLHERLQKEMKLSVIKSDIPISVIVPPERRYSEWIGGSILASLSTFENMWISRQEYDEHGVAFVHKKCRL